MTRRYVIIGSGIAGLAAAEAIRRADAMGRITLVSDEPHPFYSRPGLAYLLAGAIPERQLTIRTPEEVRAQRLERIGARVTSVDAPAHEVVFADGRRTGYDRLLLACGASSIEAVFDGAGLDGVVRLDGLDDARRILALARRARTAVVVGGGSTALELVDGLRARGIRTHYVLRGARYWSKVLDPQESDIIEGRLQEEGVVLHHHTEIRAAIGRDGRLVAVETTLGERIPCELLAVAVGIRPRIDLARSAGLAVDRGVLTNEFLEASTPDVFAAGDVAQALDPITGHAALDTLWTSALAMGRSAGANMAGARAPHVKRVPMNVTRIAGVTTTIVGAVGSAEDPDLLTLTRGQSERWTMTTAEWTLAELHTGDRVRVLVGPRHIVGAVVMGDQSLSRPLSRLIAEQVDVSVLRPALEARPNTGISLLVEFIHAWERESDAAR